MKNEVVVITDSELHREHLLRDIKHWAKHTKADFMLRQGDIEGIVGQILEEFYHVKLSCGHLVISIEDGVALAFKENDGSEVQGIYCKPCAEKYKAELGAREINIPQDSEYCDSCHKPLVILQHLDFVEDKGKKYCISCSQKGK